MKLQTRVKQMLQLHFSLSKPTAFCILTTSCSAVLLTPQKEVLALGLLLPGGGGAVQARAAGPPTSSCPAHAPGGGPEENMRSPRLLLGETCVPAVGVRCKAHTAEPSATPGACRANLGAGSASACKRGASACKWGASATNWSRITEHPLKSARSVASHVSVGHGSGPS